LDALGLRVVVVTFESAERARAFARREKIAFPIVRDPRRVAYRAFGIQRLNVAGAWKPRTIWYYMRQIVRGRLPHVARADWYQLGGDVLLARDGRVCWMRRSSEPADRPTVNTILKQARQCR
jgi:hypothetical protein